VADDRLTHPWVRKKVQRAALASVATVDPLTPTSAHLRSHDHPRLHLTVPVWFPFAYLPFLLFIPILLVLGIFFVIVPGGFIIVLARAYYASLEVLGLHGLAAGRRRSAIRANRRRAKASLALVAPRTAGSQTGQSVALDPERPSAGPTGHRQPRHPRTWRMGGKPTQSVAGGLSRAGH
jgi:hypothetical protein